MNRVVLETKLFAPRPRHGLVDRPRLVDRLDQGLGGQLILVSAPAGFGKTTLVASWLEQADAGVAWLSLDPQDSDPSSFLTYVSQSLNRVSPGVGSSIVAALVAPDPPAAEEMVTALLNDVLTAAKPLVLVLDDYHSIGSERVHEIVGQLIEHQPHNLHLVIATREDPPISISRLRARGELTEVRARDLRFSGLETAQFLNGVMSLGLAEADVQALGARTEGWAAGLLLAALALQALDGDPMVADRTAFVNEFAGDDRHVADYLVDEVISRQRDDIQHFLLRSSVLTSLCEELCDAVVYGGQKRGQSRDVLHELDRANLFVIPLDNRREWYRYHRLFADLLRHRLQRDCVDELQELHRNASRWYESRGYPAESIGHALQASDFDRAADLVERDAMAEMQAGRLHTVERWLDELPPNSVQERPWLAVASAWVLVCTGRADEVDPTLEIVREALDAEDSRVGSDSISADEARRLKAHMLGVEAHSRLVAGDFHEAESLSRRSIEDLRAAGSARAEWNVLVTLLSSLRAQIQLDGAANLLTDAMHRMADDGPNAVWVRSELGETLWIQGRLREAAEVLRGALELSKAQTPPGGAAPYTASQAHVRLSGVLREWNELESAIEHARLGVELSERWGQAEGSLTAYLNLSRTLHSANRVPESDRALERAREFALRLSPFYVKAVDTVVARRRLQAGDAGAGMDWVDNCGLHLNDEVDPPQLGRYYTLAYVVSSVGRAQNRPEDLPAASDLLRRLAAVADSSGAYDLVIRMRVAQAITLDAMDLTNEAMRALTTALELGEPEHYVRAFVDEGDPVAHLLYEAVRRSISAEYAGRLLSQFEVRDDGSTVAARPLQADDSGPPLIEPLSDREVEVLALMADGLSDREIAQRLSISVNTVKKHNSNVFGKLAVHSRTKAVARARQLGILA